MTAFNWEYVASHPFKFARICTEYGLHAVRMIVYRLLTPFKSKPTNNVTALKSLLLRIFFLRNY